LVHFVRGGTNAPRKSEQPPATFEQLLAGRQYRVDASELDAGRAARGRNVQPPRD
jgi:hypothetical protein